MKIEKNANINFWQISFDIYLKKYFYLANYLSVYSDFLRRTRLESYIGIRFFFADRDYSDCIVNRKPIVQNLKQINPFYFGIDAKALKIQVIFWDGN